MSLIFIVGIYNGDKCDKACHTGNYCAPQNRRSRVSVTCCRITPGSSPKFTPHAIYHISSGLILGNAYLRNHTSAQNMLPQLNLIYNAFSTKWHHNSSVLSVLLRALQIFEGGLFTFAVSDFSMVVYVRCA